MLKHIKHLSITTFHNVREIHSIDIVKKSQFQEYHNTQVWDVQSTDPHGKTITKLAGEVHSTKLLEWDLHECDSKNIDATSKQVWDIQSTDPHEQTTTTTTRHVLFMFSHQTLSQDS